MAGRAAFVEARMGMLPKPTYTGGVPASRNATDSAGSGRTSGRIHAGLYDVVPARPMRRQQHTHSANPSFPQLLA
jgi:hypothetical protein